VPSPGWHHDNANRAYPFATAVAPTMTLDGPETIKHLPHAVVVDFMSVYCGPGDDPQTIYLQHMSRAGNVVTFVVAASSVAASGLALTFYRNLATSPDFLGESVEAFVDDGCGPREAWSGLLVPGRIAALAAAIDDGDAWTGTPTTTPFEPTTTQSLGGRIVWSLNAGNFPRIPKAPPDGCGDIPDTPLDIVIAAPCVRGDVLVRPGYNAEIYQANDLNLLRIHGRAGAGLGRAPGEISLGPDDIVDWGGPLGGGYWCDGVIRRINGSQGANQRFVAGSGTRIGPDPDNPYILRIDFDRHDLAGGSC